MNAVVFNNADTQIILEHTLIFFAVYGFCSFVKNCYNTFTKKNEIPNETPNQTPNQTSNQTSNQTPNETPNETLNRIINDSSSLSSSSISSEYSLSDPIYVQPTKSDYALRKRRRK